MIECWGCQTSRSLKGTLPHITSANNTSLYVSLCVSQQHPKPQTTRSSQIKPDKWNLMRARSHLSSSSSRWKVRGPFSLGEPANPDTHRRATGRCRNALLLISPRSASLWLSQAHCLWFIRCYTAESVYLGPSTVWFCLCFQVLFAESRQTQRAGIKGGYTHTHSWQEIGIKNNYLCRHSWAMLRLTV